jgi:sulfate/thiosulfate transport system permease protein
MSAHPQPGGPVSERTPVPAGRRARRRNILPGFGLSMGVTVTYLSLMALIPLSTVFLKTAGMGWARFLTVVTSPRVLAAYRLSFTTSLAGAAFDAFAGLLVAWSLVRYEFPGRDLADALVDLPFALPTSVAGITLTTLYTTHGWIGKYFALAGIRVAFTPLGIVVALAFVGLPFVVRAVEPVLQDLEPELEEAAATLGADRWQTFRRVIAPALLPPMVTGFTLGFARALGEYGSVVFISGNMPMRTEITPLLIMSKLEEFDYQGATAIAAVMLVASFVILLAINQLQRWTGRFYVA